jgi:predicted transcriptional regulator
MMTGREVEFVRLYEALMHEVNQRAGREGWKSFELDAAAEKDARVRRVRKMLGYVRDIRHLLQHPQHKSDGSALEISAPFLEEVQNLLGFLRKTETASTIGVARGKIYVAQPSETLGKLADLMKQKGYSHLPILDGDDVVVGLFNEAAVFDVLWSQNELIIDRSTLLSVLLEHCKLTDERTEIFRFVKPQTSHDELVKSFRALGSANRRLGAVFVTASGKAKEPIQRMITAWDVLPNQ